MDEGHRRSAGVCWMTSEFSRILVDERVFSLTRIKTKQEQKI